MSTIFTVTITENGKLMSSDDSTSQVAATQTWQHKVVYMSQQGLRQVGQISGDENSATLNFANGRGDRTAQMVMSKYVEETDAE